MAIELTCPAAMHDETLVTLDTDQIAVIQKNLGELKMAMDFLVEMVNTRKLTVATRHSVCGCIENWASQITKACGGDSEIAATKQEKSSEIRKANMEIHRLEQLVGNKRGFDGIPEVMSLMKQTFHDYWNKLGFILVYDTPGYGAGGRGEGGGFTAGHGHLYYQAECCVHIDPDRDRDEMKPVSSKKKSKAFVEDMETKLDLYKEDRYPNVLDTPKNRECIQAALLARFPSLEIDNWQIERIRSRKVNLYHIRAIKIYLRNCQELLPTEEEQAATEAKLKAWAEQK